MRFSTLKWLKTYNIYFLTVKRLNYRIFVGRSTRTFERLFMIIHSDITCYTVSFRQCIFYVDPRVLTNDKMTIFLNNSFTGGTFKVLKLIDEKSFNVHLRKHTQSICFYGPTKACKAFLTSPHQTNRPYWNNTWYRVILYYTIQPLNVK